MSTTRLLVGSDISVHTSKQAGKGVIDVNPAFSLLRRTEGKITKVRQFTKTNEINIDRQGNDSVGEDISYPAQLSFEATEQTVDFLIDAIQGVEGVNIDIIATLSSNASGFVDSSGSLFTNLSVGDYFFIAGFVNAELNRSYRLELKNSNGSVNTDPAPAAVESEGADVTFLMNKTVSASTLKNHIMQVRIVDTSKAGGIDYQTFFDGQLSDFSLNFGETGIIPGSFNLVFESLNPGTATISGQTDNAVDTSNVLSTSENITRIWVDGEEAKCIVKSIGMDHSNNYQEIRQASVLAAEFANGEISLSGSLSVRIPINQSTEWRDKYCEGARFALAIELNHGEGKNTIIEIPQAVIADHSSGDSSSVIASSEMTYNSEPGPRGYSIGIFRDWNGGLGWFQTIITDSPVAWWRLGDTSAPVTEEITSIVTTVSGSPGFGTTSLIPSSTDTAMSFNRSPFLSAASNPVLIITGDLTMVATIKLDDLTAASMIAIYSAVGESEGNNILYGLAISADGKFVYQHEGVAAANVVVAFNFVIQPDVAYLVHLVRNSTAKTVSLYLNGALSETLGYSENATGGGVSFLRIGSSIGSSAFGGILDEFILFDKTLSADRVAEHAVAAGIV